MRNLDGAGELLASLRSGSRSAGAAVLTRSGGTPPHPTEDHCEYAARWGLVRAPVGSHTYTVVMLEPLGKSENLSSVIDAQRDTINHLLIRRALIEERERRTIGREMHDDILQELARVRGRLSHASRSGDDIADVRDDLDALIERVRKMAFELSPPILDDLGLLPAIEWLAEHMSKRYGIRIEIAKGAVNPTLDPNTRTIAFRAVRELIVNAAKHAPGADVVLSCESDESVARIGVRDTGQGFDTAETDVHNPGFRHFGLFTLAQEIRGVGGSFDLISAVGAGTHATITVPLAHGKKASHA